MRNGRKRHKTTKTTAQFRRGGTFVRNNNLMTHPKCVLCRQVKVEAG